ncbi:MAG: HAD family hydrolase [Pseudomonadota bacterium]|nr:HAD family hydrolase [Pseudomonadota bacterium]
MSPLAVFDLDGTLVDTAPDLSASLDHCLAQDGLPPMPLDLVRPHAGHGARAMLRAAYHHFSRPIDAEGVEAHLPVFLSFYEAHIADVSRPFPGVLAAMDRLEGAGWRLAVCTNKTERLARKLLEELKLAPRFAAICGADTFPAMKPDPRHLGGTIERAGGSAEKTIMIGDTLTDVAASRALSLPSILVDFGYAPDEAARAGASCVIGHYDELTIDLAMELFKDR